MEEASACKKLALPAYPLDTHRATRSPRLPPPLPPSCSAQPSLARFEASPCSAWKRGRDATGRVVGTRWGRLRTTNGNETTRDPLLGCCRPRAVTHVPRHDSRTQVEVRERGEGGRKQGSLSVLCLSACLEGGHAMAHGELLRSPWDRADAGPSHPTSPAARSPNAHSPRRRAVLHLPRRPGCTSPCLMPRPPPGRALAGPCPPMPSPSEPVGPLGPGCSGHIGGRGDGPSATRPPPERPAAPAAPERRVPGARIQPGGG